MQLEFRRLSEIDRAEIVALNTHPLVRRQMPLSDGNFDDEECRAWIEGKEKQWEDYGYGPWAFMIDGRFAGWGGLQYEDGDADLGLVLHPDFWGAGKVIYEEILRRAFEEMTLESVIILLPRTRKHGKSVLRLGFEPDGEAEIGGERFLRYRLHAPSGD
ncbi:MAG: GNAT family N-acetyltransferase [Acidobacteriota bacterium]